MRPSGRLGSRLYRETADGPHIARVLIGPDTCHTAESIHSVFEQSPYASEASHWTEKRAKKKGRFHPGSRGIVCTVPTHLRTNERRMT